MQYIFHINTVVEVEADNIREAKHKAVSDILGNIRLGGSVETQKIYEVDIRLENIYKVLIQADNEDQIRSLEWCALEQICSDTWVDHQHAEVIHIGIRAENIEELNIYGLANRKVLAIEEVTQECD